MSEAANRASASEPVPPQHHRPPILTIGDTVWKQATAEKAAVLFDAAQYFGVLRDAMQRARHSIFIVGWDIDSRTRLVGPSGAATDGLVTFIIQQ